MVTPVKDRSSHKRSRRHRTRSPSVDHSSDSEQEARRKKHKKKSKKKRHYSVKMGAFDLTKPGFVKGRMYHGLPLGTIQKWL